MLHHLVDECTDGMRNGGMKKDLRNDTMIQQRSTHLKFS